jgi:hypothetical protein
VQPQMVPEAAKGAQGVSKVQKSILECGADSKGCLKGGNVMKLTENAFTECVDDINKDMKSIVGTEPRTREFIRTRIATNREYLHCFYGMWT